jgi:hypothetical protein
MREPATLPLPGGVRRVFWVIFVATILLAFAIPVTTFWRDTTTALRVQASIEPASPVVGEAAHVVISVSDPADRADIQGPAAQIAARWDMLTMTMGTREIALPGPLGHDNALSLPLHLDMAGSWWVQVAVHVPGRPAWQTRLDITVQPSASALQRTDAQFVVPDQVALQKAPATATSAASGSIGSTHYLSPPACTQPVCAMQSQIWDMAL